MKIYFPQWQGSGTGKNIESGAKTVLDYVDNSEFIQVPLSDIVAGEKGTKKHDINNYDAITEQLSRLKKVIQETEPETIQTIGGDCGLEIVPVSYLNKKYPNLGVIWFDAHADINKPCDSASSYSPLYKHRSFIMWVFVILMRLKKQESKKTIFMLLVQRI